MRAQAATALILVLGLAPWRVYAEDAAAQRAEQAAARAEAAASRAETAAARTEAAIGRLERVLDALSHADTGGHRRPPAPARR